MTATPVSNSTLPLATGAYSLDPLHSGVYFQIRHLGLANVRGTFKSFDALLHVGDRLDDVVLRATVDLASVDTNQPDRDAHLRGTDFFDADANPVMSFHSTGVTDEGDDRYAVTGDLTINGITKAVTLDVEFNGTEVSPSDGKVHVGFTATGEIRRADFGIDFNMPLGVGKLALGEKVKIDIDAQFIAP